MVRVSLNWTRGQRRCAQVRAARCAIVASLTVALGVLGFPALAAALPTLPDGRGYEMVTPLNKNDLEVGPGIGSTNGNAVNWEAIGGCCGASSAASTLFQSTRSSSGWQTASKTPTPPGPLEGLEQEQQPLWWSADLGTTIYTTPATYDQSAVNRNPLGPGDTTSPTSFLDLYEQSPSATSPVWLTQAGPGPQRRGHEPRQLDLRGRHPGRQQRAVQHSGVAYA